MSSSIVFRWNSVKTAVIRAAEEILLAYKTACGAIQKECGQDPHPILYFTSGGIKFTWELEAYSPKGAHLEIINGEIHIRHTAGYGNLGTANTHWHGSLRSWEELASFLVEYAIYAPGLIRESIERHMEEAATRD